MNVRFRLFMLFMSLPGCSPFPRHTTSGPRKWTWTEVGWFATTFVPLIGGFVFTKYDPDATDEFVAKVSVPYGEYVAKKIIEALW